MAGRGTDIVLGGNLDNELAKLPEDDAAGRDAVRAAWKQRHELVLQAGGLCVLGSERHESRSEEHTSELQSLMRISYAVFCLKKKKTHTDMLSQHRIVIIVN